VASGARYKPAATVNMKPFEGDSVHYWASAMEAKRCAGEHIALVGASNSAGQAAVFLAPEVKRLTIVVRGEALEASMSRQMLENVEMLVHSESAEPHREPMGQLHGATVRDRRTLGTSRFPVRHVFMFIGAAPNTAWLNGCLALDEKGYILTGPRTENGTTAPVLLPLQTSLPRVFAIGDVRSGSTKRMASAVGEGAAVVAQFILSSVLWPRRHWRATEATRLPKNERRENSQMLAEVSKSRGKARIQRRPRISNEEFVVFYSHIFLCGSFAGLRS
jgi:thioredoxin reductase (NADPH)